MHFHCKTDVSFYTAFNIYIVMKSFPFPKQLTHDTEFRDNYFLFTKLHRLCERRCLSLSLGCYVSFPRKKIQVYMFHAQAFCRGVAYFWMIWQSVVHESSVVTHFLCTALWVKSVSWVMGLNISCLLLIIMPSRGHNHCECFATLSTPSPFLYTSSHPRSFLSTQRSLTLFDICLTIRSHVLI